MTKQSQRCGAALVSLAREVMRFSLRRLSVRAHWRTPARTCGAGCRLRGAACGEAAASAPRTRSSASVAPAPKSTRHSQLVFCRGPLCSRSVVVGLHRRHFGSRYKSAVAVTQAFYHPWLVVGRIAFAQSPACALCCQCGASLRSACGLSDTMLVANALLQLSYAARRRPCSYRSGFDHRRRPLSYCHPRAAVSPWLAAQVHGLTSWRTQAALGARSGDRRARPRITNGPT